MYDENKNNWFVMVCYFCFLFIYFLENSIYVLCRHHADFYIWWKYKANNRSVFRMKEVETNMTS